MLPIRNYFIDSYVMDIVLDESSDEDHETLSEHSDGMSDASEETVSFKLHFQYGKCYLFILFLFAHYWEYKRIK